MARAAAVIAAATLLAVAPAALGTVESGQVVPFRGIAGVRLHQSRAQVVAILGPAVRENAFGVMSYSDENIMDVYLTRAGARGTVRQFVASGTGFCAKGVVGACSRTANSEIAMRRAYPGRFRRVVDVTGDTVWWWCGRVGGRAISTSFNTDPARHMILTWYMADHGRRCPTIAQVRGG